VAKQSSSGGVQSLLKKAGQELRQASVIEVDMTAPGGPQLAKPRIFSILDYIEAPWGLNMKLYPVQRFIVKLAYFIPLDDRDKTITITDMFNTKVEHSFTEAEYLRFLFDEGKCNIREQDHERRDLILPIGRRAGKCVKGDTLVLTSGGIYRIEELGEAPEDEFSTVSVGVSQEEGRLATATAFYNGGIKPSYTLKTASGYTETGTANHRVRVMGASGRVEWAYLDTIKPGDFVAINRSTDLWAKSLVDLWPFHNQDGYKELELPDQLTEDWANFLGYLVGDGTWNDEHATSVTVEHPETWSYLTDLFRKLVGEPRVQMDERRANTGRLEFCSVGLRRFLDAIGWKLGCEHDAKMVPWSILRSPKKVVCAFLRGLFETDGSAESGGRHITFSTASFRLAHEVQVLLLNLGILSNVSRKWVKATQKHYAVLSIKGVRSRHIFADLIGFDSAKKREPMLASLSHATEGKSDTESIPHQYRALRDLLESVPKRNPLKGERGWLRSRLREALGNTIKAGSGEDLTYPRLTKALDVAREVGAGTAEIEHFETLLRQDYFYDAVMSVEQGEDQVYDLTVPDGQSFVANGMTNHNTTLSAIFASYEIYRLLNLNNPQAYYGLPNGNRIQIISVATDKDQASLLYNDVTTHLAKCEYFKPYIANNTLSYVQFRTPYDIERYGETSRHDGGQFVSFNGKATLKLTFKSCIAKGLRGSGNVVVILDEMAHFIDQGNSSAKEIYDAVTPSTAAFSPKNPATGMPIGPTEARVICISSPLGKSGKFFELFDLAMRGGPGSENLIAIQAPTWHVNPTVPSSYYKRKYHEDPTVFMTEHGAEFSDQVRGWIERESDLMACVSTERRPVDRGLPRRPHQMGIDVGLVGDSTAIAVTHIEGNKIILDYHEQWAAGIDWREMNPHLEAPLTEYARSLSNVERLDFDELSIWIEALCKRFYIVHGLFDRWNGIPLEQSLHKKGLKQFKSDFFTRDLSSKMFQTAKLLMFDERLELYDWPRPEDGRKHSPLIQELLTLQALQSGRNIIMVEAPKVHGAHDDLSDALVRAIWLAHEQIVNQKHVAGGNGSYTPTALGNSGLAAYQRQRSRKHGMDLKRTPKPRPSFGRFR
jgi:intein/homing endonuclease